MTSGLCHLERKPIAAWQNLTREATWTTHLNDIRMLSQQFPESIRQRALLRELKLLCLFSGRRVVIPDSDLNNNPAFQQLFMTDTHGLRSAFESGMFILALRDQAAGLADVNAQQGPRRANPEMVNIAQSFVKTFDTLYVDRQLVALEWNLSLSADGFQSSVNKLIKDPASPLMPADRELLEGVVHKSVQGDPQGRLFFGNIYGHLVRMLDQPNNHASVQAVRVAHMLNTARRLGFAPSLPLGELDPAFAHFVMTGTTTRPILPNGDDVLPSKILPETALDSLTFQKIKELQKIGIECGYFPALLRARDAVGTEASGEYYSAFLRVLDTYLREIKLGMQIELIDWQQTLIRGRSDRITYGEHLQKLLFACPPVVYSSLGVLGVLTINSNVSLLVSSLTLASAAATVIASVKRHQLMVNGSAVIPTQRKDKV